MQKKTGKDIDKEPPKRRVGRPGLGGTEALLVSVLPGTIAAIDAVAGKGRRSEFVREAIAREIKRRARLIPCLLTQPDKARF